jgi:branched-chain amino acid transport system permease protein
MATRTVPSSAEPTKTSDLLPIIFAVGMIVVSFVVLSSINTSMLLFPVWSSIAFPALAAAPFLILNLKVPRNIKTVLILAVLIVIIPLLGIENTAYLELAIQIGIFAAMALGLNVVIGFAGLLDLGYVAFFAVGAYLWGIFTSEAPTIIQLAGASAPPEEFWLFLIIGIFAAGSAGVLLGLPVLRLRGDYLAIVTLGFGEIIRILMGNLGNLSSDPSRPLNITNGAQGLHGIAAPALPEFWTPTLGEVARVLGIPMMNPTQVSYQMFYYFLVLFMCVLAVVVASRLENSPIGRAWTAIREDETAAIAMGVPLVRMKLLAFATGASFAGAMGVIFAAKQTYVDPDTVRFEQSILILSIVIVGGMGSIRGVILGAVTVTLLNLQILKNISLLLNSLRNNPTVPDFIATAVRSIPPELDPSRYERLVFGLLLILMMIFRPAGMLPAQRRKLELAERKGDPLEPENFSEERRNNEADSRSVTGQKGEATDAQR